MKLDYYDSITNGEKEWVIERLNHQNINILKGFIKNSKLVTDFYKLYYCNNRNRIVLCGINPGKLGAGKTGVPFLDFKSLSKMLPNIKDTDCELSAQFIYSVITHFGNKTFFDNVYLTNISWFGFTKDNNNFNYYNMDQDLQDEFTSGFIEEMEIVQPSVIIPLSEDTEKSLKNMNKRKNLGLKIAKRIAHPYYYSNFPTRYEDGLNKYIETINKFML